MRKPNCRENIEHRLMQKITVFDGHWLLPVCSGHEYPRIQYNGREERVCRVMAMLKLGYDLEDEESQINHKTDCPFKNCINFEHLYIGTAQENTQDSVIARTHKSNNTRKTHCRKGHEYTLENTILYKGSQICRVCQKEYNKQYKQKVREIA